MLLAASVLGTASNLAVCRSAHDSTVWGFIVGASRNEGVGVKSLFHKASVHAMLNLE